MTKKHAKRRHFRTAMRVLCGLSFMWVLGMAGASDCNTLPWNVIWPQAVGATILFYLTAWLGGLLK